MCVCLLRCMQRPIEGSGKQANEKLTERKIQSDTRGAPELKNKTLMIHN